MQYRLIDDTGLYVEDMLSDKPPTATDADGNETPDAHYIATPCPEGFYWPKWDGEKWVEGGTAPEPVAPVPTDGERLSAVEAALLTIMGAM